MTQWGEIAKGVLAGEPLRRVHAKEVLSATDQDLLPLLQAAAAVRARHFGKQIKLCMLVNAQCGLCTEDCAYCSQSTVSEADIDKYGMITADRIVARAKEAAAAGAVNFSIVTSGREPSDALLEAVIDAVCAIKAEVNIPVCASLGMLAGDQAKRLAAAGLDRYHHNINTSEGHHGKICTTHSYTDRVATIEQVKAAGLSSCGGVIIGMGESADDVVDMAVALRQLRVDSIPVNFLHPVPGTPFESKAELTPTYCLRVLAMFRLVCPDQDIRLAGGREYNLRALQPLALYAANAMFVGDLLTTAGPGVDHDVQMIRDLGLEPVCIAE